MGKPQAHSVAQKASAHKKRQQRASLNPLVYLRRWFIGGLLVTVPVLMTFSLIWWVIGVIDDNILPLLPERFNPKTYLDFDIPGFGLIVGLVVIVAIGATTSGFLGAWIVRMAERMLSTLPVVRSVYGAIKQIMETVMASQSDAFREAVLVEYPRKGIWAIGFVTGITRGEVQNRTGDELANVFIPTTPNPTSGFLLFFKRSELTRLDMSVEDAVKMVISAGIVTPNDINAAQRKKAKAKAKSQRRKKAKGA